MQVASAAVARSHSACFSGWSPPSPPLAAGSHAGMEDEYGTERPRASIADAIVFAVYIPPQAPGPGHALRTMSSRVASSTLPVMYSPYAWNAEMMSSFSSLSGRQPARIVPPYTTTAGRLTRAIAITHLRGRAVARQRVARACADVRIIARHRAELRGAHPGMFLSQPGIDTLAS